MIELLYCVGIAFTNSKETDKYHCNLRNKSVKGPIVLKVIFNVPMENKPLPHVETQRHNTIYTTKSHMSLSKTCYITQPDKPV